MNCNSKYAQSKYWDYRDENNFHGSSDDGLGQFIVNLGYRHNGITHFKGGYLNVLNIETPAASAMFDFQISIP